MRLPLTLFPLFAPLCLFAADEATPDVPEILDPKVELLQSGIKLTQLVEHPDLVTPTGIDVDIDGQIWAVSSHTHFRPETYEGPEHDEILVFDPDGSNRRVFYNATDATMDLELGPGGWVYLAERDRILRVRDSDGDGVGDVEEDLAVLETTADYPHNGLAGLCWHPGGYLVFSLGENFYKSWSLTAVDGSKIEGTGEGGVFRCTADGKQLKRIAKGFWNPFGVCVRDDLEMFVAENDPGARPPCRLLHLVEGGDYGYQRLYGNAPFHPFVAWNGELRGTLPMLDAAGEAPCGIVPLGGGVLLPSWSHNRLDFFSLARKGASYESERIELVRGSDNFRPTCIAEGPDGAFYFTDWVFTSYELHQRGRLWKLEIDREAEWLKPKEIESPNAETQLAESLRSGKAKDVDDQQLLAHARSDDPFLARAALEELSRRTLPLSPEMEEEDQANIVYAYRLANPKDEQVASLALNHASPKVRFEALRWIADEQLVGLAEDVDAMFAYLDLDYQLFEACLATAITLKGDPRKGIVDIPMLLERVKDESTSQQNRAYALRLIPPSNARLKVPVLVELTRSNSELRMEALRSIAGKNTPESREFLTKIVSDPTISGDARNEAVLGLAAEAAEHLDKLKETATMNLLSSFGNKPDAEPSKPDKITVPEAERALRMTSVKLPGAPKTIAQLGPPPMNDSAAWKALIDAVEGEPDLDVGRRIFSHPTLTRCASCHRHSGRGGIVGPDLSAVGAGPGADAEWLLSQILEPNREVSPQYFPWSLGLKDGSAFMGIALRKGGKSGKEFYRDSSGKEQGILKTDIVHREELKSSLMPPALILNLTPSELRDLIAFLQASGIRD
ncbi:MAG: putative membrane-bound dehydrogenase-like protein [Verrucomicrobiales bacterium]|jgi:putative membrane-bound dehydrogenase-like protein